MRNVITLVAVLVCAGSCPAQGPWFGEPVTTPVPGARANGHIEVLDVDGDGLDDVVVSDLVDSTIRVMLGLGDGRFAGPVTFVPPPGTVYPDPAMALGHFNADAAADLALGRIVPHAASPDFPNIAVRLGLPGGMFGAGPDLNNDPGAPFPAGHDQRGLLVADFNGDGLDDILTHTTAFPLFTPFNLSLLPGRGDGTFAAPVISGEAASSFGELAVAGDVDGDGDLDVATFVNTGSQSRASSAAKVDLNNGQGVFTLSATLTFDTRLDTPVGNARAFLVDLNRDGRADLVLYGRGGAQTGAGGITVRLSTGNGAFAPGFREAFVPGTSTILVADVTGDGVPDIIRMPEFGPGTVLVNNGAASFTPGGSFPDLGASPRDAAVIRLTSPARQAIVVMTVDDTEEQVRLVVVPVTTPALCPGDFNHTGGVSVQDVFDFLTAYFTASSAADIDGNGSVTVQDIFEFLEAWFRGCPG